MNYVVFDLEFNKPKGQPMVINHTSLTSEILQIGAVMLDEDLNELDCMDIRVKPKYYTVLDSGVAGVTHLCQRDMEYGMGFQEAGEVFRQWCGKDFVFCTWGPDDIGVLRENLRVHGMDISWLPKTYDVQRLFSIQREDVENGRQVGLVRALEMLQEEIFDAHDALNDTDNTVTVMYHLDLTQNMAECEVGEYAEYNGDLVRSDAFGTLYSSQENAVRDFALKCFVCPETGEKIACGEWTRRDGTRFITMARSSNGDDYFVSLKICRNKAGKFRASRVVFRMTDVLRELYETLTAGKELYAAG